MLEFSAYKFLSIGQSLEVLKNNPLAIFGGFGDNDSQMAFESFFVGFAKDLKEIGCEHSAEKSQMLSNKIFYAEKHEIEIHIENLVQDVRIEMGKEVFLHMPADHAKFYDTDILTLLGQKCFDRFHRIITELDEAMKCYASGRYTACAFHLMRTTEAGLRAFGIAIGYEAKNQNWGKVFEEYDKQLATPPKQRGVWWQSHGDFLEEAGGDLRSITKAWRNRTMHLDQSYGQEQAKHLLDVIPAFLKHLGERLDQDGVLY